jgi:hypothetical protein
MHFSRNPPGPNTSRIEGPPCPPTPERVPSSSTRARPPGAASSSRETHPCSVLWIGRFPFVSEGPAAEFVKRFAKTHLFARVPVWRIRVGVREITRSNDNISRGFNWLTGCMAIGSRQASLKAVSSWAIIPFLRSTGQFSRARVSLWGLGARNQARAQSGLTWGAPCFATTSLFLCS